ncbi:MAG: hypothetical protein JNM63_10150, partial [Spirochaetia bacterium]|nr:hypothetical protein [Spirochaetia bacterium]
DLKSLKNKKDDSVKDIKQVAKSEEKPADVKPEVKPEATVAETKKPETKTAKTEAPVVKEAAGTLSLSLATEGAFVSAIGADGKETRLKAGDNVLKPGKYTIKADRQGYKAAESSVVVEDGKTVAHRIDLVKKLVASEKIILLDGKTIIGKVVKQNDKEVTIETEEGVKTIKMKQIDDILYLKK